MHLVLSFVPAILLTAAGCSNAGEQLTCPVPESGQAAGTLQETPQQITQSGEALGGGSPDEIRTGAAAICARQPQARPDELVNYLVTAYCPRINGRAGLGRADKAAALSTFSSRAESVLHLPVRQP